MDKTRVLIIGGGAVGACTAFFVHEAGFQVILVDRGKMGSGASHGNMGLVVPSHSIPLAAPGVVSQGLKWMIDPYSPFYIKPRLDMALFKWLWQFWRASEECRMRRAIPLLRDMSLVSLSLFEELNALEGVDFDFHRRGVLEIFGTKTGQKEGREHAHLLSSFGLDIASSAPNEVAGMLPGLNVQQVGGLHFRQDAHLTPSKFVSALSNYLERQGVEVRPHTEVLQFNRKHGRIASVKTNQGEIAADEFVLAAGSWSPALSKTLNLDLPIQPAKGYSVTIKRPPEWPELPILLSESRIAITPRGDTLRFGGTLELAGFNSAINPRRVEAIVRAIPKYFAGFDLTQHRRIETWCGLRPCTPDGLPCLGRPQSASNLTIAAGHAMIGVSLGPVTGMMVRRILAGEPIEIDLSPLSPDRFAGWLR